MVNISTVASSENRSPLRRLPVPAYFCLLALIVFATQFAGTGFGERPHHGWVSSHTLAIAGRATPENGFLAHSRLLIDEEGALHYDYFDRYPPFFSATPGALTGLTNNLATKVWLARQIMHVILVLMMLFAWLLLRRLGMTAGLALPPASPGDAGSGWRLYRTLTPENRVAFLFDKSYVEHFPPEQISAAHNFGTSVALGHWGLYDNTQVQPCQRIRVESWWQAIRAPVPDHSMQLALVNLAGESLSARNARLTTVDSSMWKTKAWFLDLRSLTVPCGAPAGEYPLVLSVYDPLLLAEEGPLPLINADGSVGDAWLYLTTLFVN
ncbi:MAG: hypothetical protein OXF63_14025 [Anaerolineaceae bacterium]|nr:hypothetical protein [Anaerolineaceae bacterium]